MEVLEIFVETAKCSQVKLYIFMIISETPSMEVLQIFVETAKCSQVKLYIFMSFHLCCMYFTVLQFRSTIFGMKVPRDPVEEPIGVDH